MVRASALESDYVLMDPGSNPRQVNFYIVGRTRAVDAKFQIEAPDPYPPN